MNNGAILSIYHTMGTCVCVTNHKTHIGAYRFIEPLTDHIHIMTNHCWAIQLSDNRFIAGLAKDIRNTKKNNGACVYVLFISKVSVNTHRYVF